jgi:hypothetical protein
MNLPLINPPALFPLVYSHTLVRTVYRATQHPSIHLYLAPRLYPLPQSHIHRPTHPSFHMLVFTHTWGTYLTTHWRITDLLTYPSIHPYPARCEETPQSKHAGTEQGSQPKVCCSLAVSDTSLENACVGQTLNPFGNWMNCIPISNFYLAVHHCLCIADVISKRLVGPGRWISRAHNTQHAFDSEAPQIQMCICTSDDQTSCKIRNLFLLP